MSYKLVDDDISKSTIEAFEQLAEAARSGVIVGGGFVAMLKGRKFFVNLCGAAIKDPVLMRGALLSLDDQLRDLVTRRTDAPPTL